MIAKQTCGQEVRFVIFAIGGDRNKRAAMPGCPGLEIGRERCATAPA